MHYKHRDMQKVQDSLPLLFEKNCCQVVTGFHDKIH